MLIIHIRILSLYYSYFAVLIETPIEKYLCNNNFKMWSNSEMHFLRKQFLINTLDGNWLEWLLIKMVATHYVFLLNFSPQVKHLLILTWLNISFKLLIIGCNQGRYVSRGICLEWLPPLRKSSASLGKGWLESTRWPVAWHGVL